MTVHRPTGWAAPKDQYAVPVLFNPYTGEPRDVRDVQSDPQGILIVPPGKVHMLAAPQPLQPAVEPVSWGVDWGSHGDRSCVSIIKKHANGALEVVATEYGPVGSAPQPQQLAAGPVSNDLRDRLVAISEAIAVQDDRAAQAMIREILSAPHSQQEKKK